MVVIYILQKKKRTQGYFIKKKTFISEWGAHLYCDHLQRQGKEFQMKMTCKGCK